MGPAGACLRNDLMSLKDRLGIQRCVLVQSQIPVTLIFTKT